MKEGKTFKISPSDFVPRYDMKFHGYIGIRGGKKYSQPSSDWIGIAIKASGLYDNGDDTWLGQGANSWSVAYHGIKNIAFTLPRVLEGNKLGGGL